MQRVRKIDKNSKYALRMGSLSASDPQSSVHAFYQVTAFGEVHFDKQFALLMLLSDDLDIYVYDKLRTQEQLGYVVTARIEQIERTFSLVFVV